MARRAVEQHPGTDETHGSLMMKCHLWAGATVMLVMLLSPASSVFGPAVGISPQAWLTEYLKYVAVLITLAILVSVGGFSVADSYWLRAHGTR